jgi:hypothetical protein
MQSFGLILIDAEKIVHVAKGGYIMEVLLTLFTRFQMSKTFYTIQQIIRSNKYIYRSEKNYFLNKLSTKKAIC